MLPLFAWIELVWCAEFEDDGASKQQKGEILSSCVPRPYLFPAHYKVDIIAIQTKPSIVLLEQNGAQPAHQQEYQRRFT